MRPPWTDRSADPATGSSFTCSTRPICGRISCRVWSRHVEGRHGDRRAFLKIRWADGVASLAIGSLLTIVTSFWRTKAAASLPARPLHDPVLDHIQRRVRADSRIERVAEIATLHLGPTSVLVALTVAFKPSLTLTDLRAAIRDLTMGLKEVD